MKIKISENKVWSFVIFAFLAKLIFFLYLKWFVPDEPIFGGGNDADYYHGYAVGYYKVVTNYWPIFLRFLNELNLYNREKLTYILFGASIILLPFLYYQIVKIKDYEFNLVKASSILLIIFYPSIFFYATDIYRDIFMFIILLICFFIYKKILESNRIVSYFYFLIYLCLSYFLFLLRDYLGIALILSPFVYLILLKTKKYIKTWIVVYCVILILLKIFGRLDEVLSYREGFSHGGTTIGIKLLNQNSFMFLFYYLYSLIVQLFGLFIVNLLSLFTFIFESVPFTLAFIYLIKNVKFMDKFVIFLLTFFVIYTSIWLLGNDNLGTATRLRIPSYLVIFACMFIVYQRKMIIGFKTLKMSKEI